MIYRSNFEKVDKRLSNYWNKHKTLSDKFGYLWTTLTPAFAHVPQTFFRPL